MKAITKILLISALAFSSGVFAAPAPQGSYTCPGASTVTNLINEPGTIQDGGVPYPYLGTWTMNGLSINNVSFIGSGASASFNTKPPADVKMVATSWQRVTLSNDNTTMICYYNGQAKGAVSNSSILLLSVSGWDFSNCHIKSNGVICNQ